MEPLMCSDITFGYNPITQPKASQTKDLHGGPSLGAAGSNAAFQKGPVGKHTRGAPAQDPCPVRAAETGREALRVTAQTRGPNPPAPQGKSSDRI